MVCTQLAHVLDVGVRGVGEVKVRTFGGKEKGCLHNKNTILRMSYVFCMELHWITKVPSLYSPLLELLGRSNK